jgi:RHS repeat-associated protein
MKHQNYNVERLDFDQYPDIGVELVPMPAVANASYNYKYNGKELQEELGLNMYDYGARNYDPALGRWLSIDPLAEIAPNKTPYHFCSNNPINRIDPTGLTDYKVNGETRTINDGHNDVSMKVSERQFNKLQSKFDNGGSGYEKMMNRLSDKNGFRTTSSSLYTDSSGNTGINISSVIHKAGSGTYADWSKNKSLGNLGQVNDVVDNIGGSLGANAGLTSLGSNGKLYFETPNGGVFRGNQYASTTSIAKYGSKIGRVTGPFGHTISAGQIGYGVYRDGGQFGYNAQVAAGGVAGGMVGAWAGAEVGAYSGSAIGGAIGVWFFGVGAAPGAAIGGVVGGIVGGITGGYYGGELGEKIVK